MSQENRKEELSCSGFPIGRIHNADFVLQRKVFGSPRGNIYDDKDFEFIVDASSPLDCCTALEIIDQKLARLNNKFDDVSKKFKKCQELALGEKGYWRLLKLTPVDVNDSIAFIMHIDTQIYETMLKIRFIKTTLAKINTTTVNSLHTWIKNIETDIRKIVELTQCCLEAIASYDKDPPIGFKIPIPARSLSSTDSRKLAWDPKRKLYDENDTSFQTKRVKGTNQVNLNIVENPTIPTSGSSCSTMDNNGNDVHSGSESDSTDSESPAETSYEYPSGYGTENSQEHSYCSQSRSEDDDESIDGGDISRYEYSERNNEDPNGNNVNNDEITNTNESDQITDDYTEESPLIQESKPWWKCGCTIL